MVHQVAWNEELVDEMNDPIYTNDVTQDHFGFPIQIDTILREKGCDEMSHPRHCPVSHLPQWPSNDRSDILRNERGKGIVAENYLFHCDLNFVAR